MLSRGYCLHSGGVFVGHWLRCSDFTVGGVVVGTCLHCCSGHPCPSTLWCVDAVWNRLCCLANMLWLVCAATLWCVDAVWNRLCCVAQAVLWLVCAEQILRCEMNNLLTVSYRRQDRVRREKAIRHVMNLFNYDLGRRCLIAEAWVVSSRLDEVGAALKRGCDRSASQVACAPLPPCYVCAYACACVSTRGSGCRSHAGL